MNFLKKIFGKKDAPINSYKDFWEWFEKHEKSFFTTVKNHKEIEKKFFDLLSPKLDELREDFFFLTGMAEDDKAELILTADGNIKNIVFVEEIIAAAPQLKNWKFTALKPPLDIADVGIQMGEYKFNSENISFQSNDHPKYPDEIDLTIFHSELNKENKSLIGNGIYIFLDNYLGELNFVVTIDSITIKSKNEAKGNLIPIEKLKKFLIWRQKEFIEKYQGKRYNTDDDIFSSYKATTKKGKPMVAVMNSSLLNWDSKASHPWMIVFTIHYDGSEHNGLPNEETYELLDQIEETVLSDLKDFEGYLNIGRVTADNQRKIYFGCNDFRKSSKVLTKVQKQFKNDLKIDFEIFKDKYWRSLEHFEKVV